MRLGPGRDRAKRSRQRGTAVVEFALCLFILVPLMLGMIDYAYYFYVGMNVVEAQHEGLLAAGRTVVSDCTVGANAAAKAAAITAAEAAETAYMTSAGLTNVTLVTSTWAPACPCSAAVTNTCWDLNLSADFTPIVGWVGWWMKKSPSTPTQVRFTAKKQVVTGK